MIIIWIELKYNLLVNKKILKNAKNAALKVCALNVNSAKYLSANLMNIMENAYVLKDIINLDLILHYAIRLIILFKHGNSTIKKYKIKLKLMNYFVIMHLQLDKLIKINLT